MPERCSLYPSIWIRFRSGKPTVAVDLDRKFAVPSARSVEAKYQWRLSDAELARSIECSVPLWKALHIAKRVSSTGTISVNDAAARKTVTEDMLIIVVYVMRNEIEAQILEPEMVYAHVIIHITRHSGQIATKWAV